MGRDTSTSEFVNMATWSTSDVENPTGGVEPENLDEMIDLAASSVGEGIAEIRRTEVIGDGFEPVIDPRVFLGCTTGLDGIILWHRPRWRPTQR